MKIELFDVIFGLILSVLVGLMILLLIWMFDGYAKSNAVKAQYPDDFTAIIEQCGEQAASSVVVSGISIKSFNAGTFISCAAQHDLTFELNGDAVKVRTNAD